MLEFNFCFSRDIYLSIETRQSAVFQRVQTLDNQLKNLSQRIVDIQRLQSKLNDFHRIIQRKFQQINEYHSTINIDENHERLIFIQVDFFFYLTAHSNILFSFQTILESLNENDIHLKELTELVEHTQPNTTEFIRDLRLIQSKQEAYRTQAKVQRIHRSDSH